MSKILITGGAGYIGSMLCTKLLDEGHSVTSVDLLKYDKGSLNHLYHNREGSPEYALQFRSTTHPH